jgi:peptidyl-tRNA hydrolase
MGIGKTAAQVAHASLGIVLAVRSRDANIYEYYRDHPSVEKWLDGRFTKLVVYVKSKEKLMNLARKLDNDGIGVKLIYDACFTALEPEEENGTTLTCMGVIPIERDMVPRYLKKLQLLD